MVISKRFKIFKSYINILKQEKKEYQNIDIKRIFLHFYKSDFIIIFVSEIYFFLFNLLSLVIYRKNIYNLKNIKQKIVINIIVFILQPLRKKIDELIITIFNIQNNNFKEKTKFEDFDLDNELYFEHIVIGSGPSGSISSFYLNKEFKNTLLIERGGGYSTYNTKHPSDEFLYKWKDGGINTSLYKTQIVFSSGECLGGGSEINSGLLHFPDENFVNEWKKEYGAINIEQKELLSCLKEVSEICKFSYLESNNITSAKFFEKGSLINNYKIEKLNSFQVLQDGEIKKNSMKNTIIKEYLKDNGKILTRFDVKKIYFSNNFWFLEGFKNKRKIKIKCKYLFLCCGSIETSKLLISSGIKTTKKPSNYSLHPMIKVIAEFKDEVQSGKENVHSFQVTEFFPKYILGEAASGIRFLKMATIDDKDIQKKIDLNWKKMSIYHATFSIGKGKLFKIPYTDKFIKLYFIDRSEKEILISAYINLCKLLFSGGAREIYLLGNKITNIRKENYEDVIRKSFKKINDFKFSSVHILGGITSGENGNAITDTFGQLKGQKNLFVNDSSLINNKLLKNPQGLIMSIAKNNIDNFIKKHK